MKFFLTGVIHRRFWNKGVSLRVRDHWLQFFAAISGAGVALLWAFWWTVSRILPDIVFGRTSALGLETVIPKATLNALPLVASVFVLLNLSLGYVLYTRLRVLAFVLFATNGVVCGVLYIALGYIFLLNR